MVQYKGIKEILKKFWNTSRIWIKNNFTAKKLGKLEFHSTVAENGHTVINMGNDAVNIYIHKDGRYARFDKMPTEGSIQKNTDLFKVELFPDTCIIDSFGVSIDVSWNTISNDDADNDVIETLRNHINSIGNPHDTSVDNIIGLSVVGRTGNYNDLNNKPTIPEAQVQSDWEATEGIGVILNKPTIGTAAAKNYTSSISNNSTDLPTAEAVYSFINSLGIENIITQIGNINTNIDNIEQQLSNIFSAESKVTDFNTTKDSGIYYWIDDAANKPGTSYGVLLVNKYEQNSSIWVNQVAYGTNNKIYFRQNINSGSWTGWKAVAFDGETTAYKVANALTVNGKTYDGSSAVNAGVQTVANGGTGVTTQADINKAFVGNLDVGESDVTDGTEFVSSFASDNGFAETTEGAKNRPYKRKFIKVWNYIKGKISSVLGLTENTIATLRTNADQGYLCKLYQLSSATSDSKNQAYNVILLGKIPDPASTAAPATPANSWDIDVDFYFVRAQGHKAAWCNVKAGYGYSNAWRKYGLIETFGVDAGSSYENPFYLVTLKYNNEWYIGVRHKCDIDGDYSARVKNVNIYGSRNPTTVDNTPLANMLKVIPYLKTNSSTVLNDEIKTSIADFPNTYAPTVERNGFLILNGGGLLLKNYNDTSLSSYGNEPLSIGNSNGSNLGIDANEIQARNNGKAATLYLNNLGGDVQIGTSNVTGAKLTLQCSTVNSNSYADTNPKLVFKNADESQNISLTFTDYDAVQAPASLTLNGNQGNEYFIAPCIKANNVMKIPTSAPSTKENGCIWIG